MTEMRSQTTRVSVDERADDVCYVLLLPFIALYRFLTTSKRYRVTYTFDNGMTLATNTQVFTADHDRQARRKVLALIGHSGSIKCLEECREVRV